MNDFDPCVLDKIVALFDEVGPAMLDVPTWWQDQFLAAHRDVEGALRRTVSVTGWRTSRAGYSTRALAILYYAHQRHTRTRCPHVISASSPMPMIVAIDSGWAACLGCSRSLVASPLDDDDRCRLCDRASETFRFHEVGAGPVLFMVEACPACSAELRGEQ
jgi:hypothetical protein